MIQFTELSKRYGTITAIDRLTAEISGNGIYGLLGKNGAGKTTLMKLLGARLYPTQGNISVFGKQVSPYDQSPSVHFIENSGEQFNMRISDLIDAAYRVQGVFDVDFARRMARAFELDQRKTYKQLSLGMKSMVAAILSLANTAPVLLLDEPALGLDPVMREQFNTLLYESYTAHERIIIISTHLVDDLARITEKLIVFDKGKILLQTDITEIDSHAYTLTGPRAVLLPLVETLNCIGKTSAGSILSARIYDEWIDPPAGVTLERLSLQDFFITLVGGLS
ncbi:MAG: ABC transporter ATP-binding protein [Treponema sp.]|jgi:ABC-2 type transport system ATP-binding protein|nr:ABC transporter ATP-binding protein [Treponema sp.]